MTSVSNHCLLLMIISYWKIMSFSSKLSFLYVFVINLCCVASPMQSLLLNSSKYSPKGRERNILYKIVRPSSCEPCNIFLFLFPCEKKSLAFCHENFELWQDKRPWSLIRSSAKICTRYSGLGVLKGITDLSFFDRYSRSLCSCHSTKCAICHLNM